MDYIAQSLGQNEKLLYEARFHWLYYAAAWAALFVLFVFAVWILLNTAAWIQWLLLGASGFGVLIVLRGMIPIWTTEIAVTNLRLIVKRGWLSRSTDELQLTAIEQVNLSQGFLGKLLDFGRVDVHGTGSDDVWIPEVAAPVALLKAIQDAANQSRSLNRQNPQ